MLLMKLEKKLVKTFGFGAEADSNRFNSHKAKVKSFQLVILSMLIAMKES